MDFKEAIAKLKKSREFKKFKEQNKDSYLCTAFFIVDLEGNQSTAVLNFQLKDERIAAFSVGEDITFKIEDLMIKKKVNKLKEDIKVDIEEVLSIAKKQIAKKEVKGKISKIMVILGKEEGQQLWNVTCFLEGLQILNIHIDSDSGKLLKSEKMALTDFFSKPADYIG